MQLLIWAVWATKHRKQFLKMNMIPAVFTVGIFFVRWRWSVDRGSLAVGRWPLFAAVWSLANGV